MTRTTYAKFNANTEGLEVAKAFADNIVGRTVLVTGVNKNGIGFTTAQAFASQSPAHLIIAGRNLERVQESIDAIKADYPNVDYRPLQINLASQKSVRAAANEVLSWDDIPEVNIMVNSAGIMCIPERTLSDEGIEIHFATNHIGHWLLTCLVAPKLIKAAQASTTKGATRVVNVSSASPLYSAMRWSDINFEKKIKDLPVRERPNAEMLKFWGHNGDLAEESYLPIEGYNQSKVANVLGAIGLNQRLLEKHGVLSLAVHPGIIITELGRNQTEATKEVVKGFFANGSVTPRTLGAGSSTSMVAALDPNLSQGPSNQGSENHGVYLQDCQVEDGAHPLAVSSEEAERLWKLSETLVGQEFAW